MAFGGQVLRFDQDAYWVLGIGVGVVGSFVFLLPATWITFTLLQTASTRMAYGPEDILTAF